MLLSEGRDPYAWYLAGNAGERILMSQEPNYLHLLYVLLLPFAYLSWPAAKLAWALTNVAAAVAAAHILARDCRPPRRPLRRGDSGLPRRDAGLARARQRPAEPVVLLALTLAWRVRASAAGGVYLALGAVKYSFLPTLALWMLAERRARALAVAAATLGLGFLAFLALTGADPLAAAFAPLRVSARATHEGLGDVMSLARALGAERRRALCARPRRRRRSRRRAVAVSPPARRRHDLRAAQSRLAVLLFHHLYDYVLLLPLFVRALTFSGLQRAATLAYVGYFWFVFKQLDGPAMQTPAVVALTALVPSRCSRLTLRLGAPSLLEGTTPTGERAACPSSTASPPSASRCPNPPLRSPITSAP